MRLLNYSIFDWILNKGSGGVCLENFYYFDPLKQSSFSLNESFTGEFTILVSTFNGATGLPSDFSDATYINTPVGAKSDSSLYEGTGIQVTRSVTNLTEVISANFDGVLWGYALDGVWYYVNQGYVLAPQTIAMRKFLANQEAYITNPTFTFDTTQHIKVEAEAPFSRIRVWLWSKDALATGQFKVSAAPTERSGTSTDTDRYRPVIGGAIDDNAWSDAASGVFNGGARSAPEPVNSGWLNVESVPSTDDPSGRCYALLRVYISSAGQAICQGSSFDFYRAASNQPWFRLYDGKTIAGDTTESAATYPVGKVFSGGAFWTGVEFDYNVPCKSIFAVGDSKTSGGGGQTATFDQWSFRAAYQASTPSEPWESCNLGMSGIGSNSFTADFVKSIDAGMRPTVVFCQSFTGNDGDPTQASIDNMINNLIIIANKCAEIGARCVMTSSMPRNGYQSSADAFRMQTVDWVNNPANQATYNFETRDWNQLLGEFNATDNAWRWKTGYAQPDGIHPSETAIQVMADDVVLTLGGS